MNPELPKRIIWATLAASALLVLASLAIWGADAAMGAAVAGAISLLNAFLIERVTAWTTQGRLRAAGLGFVAIFKTVFLMLLCWVCVTKLHLDFNGFLLGIGALVLGVLGGSALSAPPQSAEPLEDNTP